MHGWIKIMEYNFNICKTLSIGGNYNRTNTKLENECVSEEKMRIQQALRSEIGIIVDCTAQGGAGNSNCGNTGRRFFEHPEIVARILHSEFPKEVLDRLKNVLLMCSSLDPVDPDKMQEYCHATHSMLINTFEWGMPPGVHVLLMHSHQAARVLPLPLGFWSEEAQESINKIMKRFRRCHARTDTEEHTNYDTMMRLLNASDPELLMYSKSWNKDVVRQELPEDLKAFLLS